MIEVLQAHEIGRKIQCRVKGSNEWMACCSDPVWNFSSYDYRVSREPRKFFVIELEDGICSGLFQSREKAISAANDFTRPYDILKLVEVVE